MKKKDETGIGCPVKPCRGKKNSPKGGKMMLAGGPASGGFNQMSNLAVMGDGGYVPEGGFSRPMTPRPMPSMKMPGMRKPLVGGVNWPSGMKPKLRTRGWGY